MGKSDGGCRERKGQLMQREARCGFSLTFALTRIAFAPKDTIMTVVFVTPRNMFASTLGSREPKREV